MTIVHDPAALLDLTVRIASVGAVLSSVELIGSPLPGGSRVSARPPVTLSHAASPGVVDRLLVGPGFQALMVARVLLALVLIVSPWGWRGTEVLVLALALLSALIPLRSSFGFNTADQVLPMVFGIVGLVALRPSSRLMVVGLVALAFQACLSYLTAGAGKLASRVWRDGSGLTGLMSTRLYGERFLHRLLVDRPWAARVMAWGVMVPEATFPLAVLLPPPAVVAWVVWGVLFHLAGAVIMGLNNFLWAYLAFYPAILGVAYLNPVW